MSEGESVINNDTAIREMSNYCCERCGYTSSEKKTSYTTFTKENSMCCFKQQTQTGRNIKRANFQRIKRCNVQV